MEPEPELEAEAAFFQALSAQERKGRAAADALAAALEDDTARATAELAAVRADMLAARADVQSIEIVQQQLGLGAIEEIEVLLHICSFLESLKDLGRLACVSRTFGHRLWWPCADESGGGELELRSIVEEAARRWMWRGRRGSTLGSTKSVREYRFLQIAHVGAR